MSIPAEIDIWLFSGCNLSPLLFSLFISDMGPSLNQSGSGIDVMDVNISCLMFADDLVLVGKSEAHLKSLMSIVLDYFSSHHLEISVKKSKVMMYKPTSGKMSFSGPGESLPILLDHVLNFKYLGVPLACPAQGMFRSFNTNIVKKSENYMRTVLSLVKNGPDRSSLAHTLWTRMALPAILYGTEILPLTQCTINAIERCQSSVGKFILQLPRNSTNVVANLDAGLRPIWSIIAERFLSYSLKTMHQPSSYWPKIAFEENIKMGVKSAYTKTLIKYRTSSKAAGLPVSQMKKQVLSLTIQSVKAERRKYCVSSFSMSCPSSFKQWFKPKPWVNDSALSKIFASYRACNASLGNRGYSRDGHRSKLCILCEKDNIYALNNECHMLIECPAMTPYRQTCDLGTFISVYKVLQPSILSTKLMSLYLLDPPGTDIKRKGLALYYMQKGWENLVGIQ